MVNFDLKGKGYATSLATDMHIRYFAISTVSLFIMALATQSPITNQEIEVKGF